MRCTACAHRDRGRSTQLCEYRKKSENGNEKHSRKHVAHGDNKADGAYLSTAIVRHVTSKRKGEQKHQKTEHTHSQAQRTHLLLHIGILLSLDNNIIVPHKPCCVKQKRVPFGTRLALYLIKR